MLKRVRYFFLLGGHKQKRNQNWKEAVAIYAAENGKKGLQSIISEKHKTQIVGFRSRKKKQPFKISKETPRRRIFRMTNKDVQYYSMFSNH